MPVAKTCGSACLKLSVVMDASRASGEKSAVPLGLAKSGAGLLGVQPEIVSLCRLDDHQFWEAGLPNIL